MQKALIDLNILLPDVPDESDACVNRLITALEGREGIEKVHIKHTDQHAQLCFHFDPSYTNLEKVKSLAHIEGAEITRVFGHRLVSVRGIMHARHARVVEHALQKVRGMLTVSASASGFIQVEYDQTLLSTDELLRQIKALGLEVISVDGNGRREGHERPHAVTESIHDHSEEEHPEEHATAEHAHHHGGLFGEKSELIFSLICGLLLGIGFALSFFNGIRTGLPVFFYAGAYFFGGFYTTREAIEAITKGSFEIDFLMLVAAVGAAILGQWAEGALLLFLFSLGHSLEHYAMEKARKSISALTELAPKTALLKKGAEVEEVPVSRLKPGDDIVVKPHTRIPADGMVITGSSSVDQSPITGESIPVDKIAVDPGTQLQMADQLDSRHRVFAGSINGNDSLEIRVTRETRDSTLSRLVQMVNEAQTQKSPTQHFTDRIERFFVPAVLVLVVLLCFAFLVIDEKFGDSFYRAMAVLVAASPCALAISTPSAVLSGVARAARAGVLIKGGGPLENLGTLTAVAFDKTGTLTEGKPRLTQIVPYGGTDETILLKWVVAAESLSDHPIAKAIVRDGADRLKDQDLPTASKVEAIQGKGIRAEVDGENIYIGNPALFESLDAYRPGPDLLEKVKSLEALGNTTMIVRMNRDYIGILGVMDVPRPEARQVINELKLTGIRRMIMLTGDNQQVADAVSGQIGITDAWGGLLPEQKVESIQKLKAQEKEVAMVGDGVNDAPAMANSTVGIAMGAAGSDVALETADVALMGDKLLLLPFAIGLSRKAKSIIRQNLVISLGMVVILIPLTIAGYASIGPAVIAHEGSTLLVVFNALRLLAYK